MGLGFKGSLAAGGEAEESGAGDRLAVAAVLQVRESTKALTLERAWKHSDAGANGIC